MVTFAICLLKNHIIFSIKIRIGRMDNFHLVHLLRDYFKRNFDIHAIFPDL